MNKIQLKATLDEAGVSYEEAATNKELKALVAKIPNIEEPEPEPEPAPEPETQEGAESPADNAAAKQIDALKLEPAPEEISEEDILKKTTAGLTRTQAIEVLEAQARHDAEQAALKKGQA